MQTVTTIGLDITKSVFQVHGVDATGQVVVRRQLKRCHVVAFFQKLPPCLRASHRTIGHAASVAIRILGGENAGDIREPSGSRPKFDWREMRRWGISESHLMPALKNSVAIGGKTDIQRSGH
jgi:hypothetical protein